jgi:hypothetical protein
MAYNPNIPQGTDTPANSQPQILANFQGINTLINVNHVEFDDPDQGKHKWVSLPQQSTSPVTLATEVALYGLQDAQTTVEELTFRRPSNGAVIPMTAFSAGTSGWTMLPSGILLKWQTVTVTGAVTINANSFGKPFTTLYSIQLSNQSSSPTNSYVAGGVIAGTNFNIYVGEMTSPSVNATTNVNWLAIGI